MYFKPAFFVVVVCLQHVPCTFGKLRAVGGRGLGAIKSILVVLLSYCREVFRKIYSWLFCCVTFLPINHLVLTVVIYFANQFFLHF